MFKSLQLLSYANKTVQQVFDELDTNQEGDSKGKLDQAEIGAAKTKFNSMINSLPGRIKDQIDMSQVNSIWADFETKGSATINDITERFNCNAGDNIADVIRGNGGYVVDENGNEVTDDLSDKLLAKKGETELWCARTGVKRVPMGLE